MLMKKFLLSLAAVAFAMTASAETNLLQNGGFESWTDGVADHWTTVSTAGNATVSQSSDAHSGASSALVANASKNKRLAYEETTLGTGKYTFSFYAKAAAEGAKVRAGYTPIGADGKVGSYIYSDDIPVLSLSEWMEVSYSFELAAETKICLVIMTPQNTADCLVDDAELICTEGGSSNPDPDPEPEPEVNLEGVISIAEAQAAAVDTKVKVYGTVAALCTQGAVVGDESGYIYYYNQTISGVAVGDEVVIEGKISAYGGFNQLSQKNDPETTVATVAKGQKVTYPEAVVLDGAALEAWFNDPKIEYVSVKGELNISGSYYNLKVEGTDAVLGSILYPTADLKEKMSNGSTVTIKGFAMYTSGGKYVNIVVTDVVTESTVQLNDISNTAETAYTAAEAIALIDDPKSDLSKEVFVKGIVSKVDSYNATYGSITYWIDNDTFEVYAGLNIGGEKFASKDDILVGDEVVVKGTLTKYNTTYEFNKNNELVSIVKNGTTPDPVEIQAISIAEFLEKADTQTAYELTGEVTEIVNTTYGNLYIKEGEATLYIYGVLDLEGQSKNFASLNIEVGDKLTVQGVYTTFKDEPQVKNAQFVKVEKGTGTALAGIAAQQKSVEIYNILGQRVSNMSQKGIYVVNGKKFIVR